MEKYSSDDKLKKLLLDLIGYVKWNLRYDNQALELQNNMMNKFIDLYQDELSNIDFLDLICKELKNNNYSPHHFLISITKYYTLADNNRLEIIRYLFKTFPNKIKKNMYDICYVWNAFQDPYKWLECIELFDDPIYQFDHNVVKENYDPMYKHLYDSYLDRYREVKKLNKENDEMRKKIEELELQIKYQPGGEGYLEAKEHFESLKN